MNHNEELRREAERAELRKEAQELADQLYPESEDDEQSSDIDYCTSLAWAKDAYVGGYIAGAQRLPAATPGRQLWEAVEPAEVDGWSNIKNRFVVTRQGNVDVALWDTMTQFWRPAVHEGDDVHLILRPVSAPTAPDQLVSLMADAIYNNDRSLADEALACAVVALDWADRESEVLRNELDQLKQKMQGVPAPTAPGELVDTMIKALSPLSNRDKDVNASGWEDAIGDCAYECAQIAQQHIDAALKKLQAFKDYVHGRLDAAGIPTHPDGEHSKAGCRIGDRLDIALKPTAPWELVDAMQRAIVTNDKTIADEALACATVATLYADSVVQKERASITAIVYGPGSHQERIEDLKQLLTPTTHEQHQHMP